ncbi:DNA-binding protein [Gallibacterium anatis]|uniref:DNA-binding protein n=1 Tax=Gallibacterium anatis TaxID=750 RepID=UPI00254FE5AB|nr:DNA-binding protein [Gallibacterium anatis]MDK9561527.1 DNA-binding protein [Gallibacterium anatis]
MNNPIIIYNTEDGKTKVSLYAQDGTVWLNQNQLAELFATSISNINKHIANILKEGELSENSVIEYFSITATNGSDYNLVL